MRGPIVVAAFIAFTGAWTILLTIQNNFRVYRWRDAHANCNVDLFYKDRADLRTNAANMPSPTIITNATSVAIPVKFNISAFFETDLVVYPEETNKLSSLLTTRTGVIEEAQRIHLNIFTSLLAQYTYAMLFNYIASENKGDSAIGVGEFLLLHKLNITIIFACAAGECTEKKTDEALDISKKYRRQELVILFHGGGNVIGWPKADLRRAKVIPRFTEFQIVMFPQSILYIDPQSHIDFCRELYASHDKLTFVWRDTVSFKLGKSLFPKVKSLLAPDIAYQIGQVSRYIPPTHDILWLKRTDKESPVYELPPLPENLRVNVSDWVHFITPQGNSRMENVFLMTANGLTFLQRGRVVITDRLHGHILCTLLGIPHVYIDNKQHKISNYHNTWTASVENIVLANSSSAALAEAIKLLRKLDKTLPAVKGFHTTA